MKRLSTSIFIGLLASAFVLLSSCKENYTPTEESSLGDVKTLSTTEKELVKELDTDLSEDLITEEILDEVIADLEQFDFKKSESTCPVITWERPEDAKYPRTVTKDFGEGCANDWGVERSGKIIITIYGKWLEEGSIRTVTFENYTSRGISVSGEKEIKCLGQNDDSLFVHKIVGDLTLIKRDSVEVRRLIHKRRTILCGIDDRNVNMEWLIDGHVKVKKSTGIQYTMSIEEPLHRIRGCKWYQSGIKRIDLNLTDERSSETRKHRIRLDYSYSESEDTAACDNFALRYVDDKEPVVVELK